LPVAQAFTFLHERDRRPVFVFPWEGATVVGTTDLDHREDLDQSASISAEELDYLLAACTQQFPGAEVVAADVLSTWSGVRPVVGSVAGELKPSNETREHVLWQEPGCVTLAGGKLTTFRPQAIEVLRACASMLERPFNDDAEAVFAVVPPLAIPGLSASQWRRQAGRHGRDLPRLAQLIAQLGHETVGSTDTLWAELAVACETEMVLHLDDLLLRRTRLGLLLPRGGEDCFAAIRQLCQPRLGWDDERWQQEIQRYRALWQRHHGLPDATH
jgi:glycerol-3-phosphate dehydrogenase